MVRVYLTEIPDWAVEVRPPASRGAAHGRQSAAAHRLLELALEREYPELAGTFQMEKDGRGKPFLRGHREIGISISHSGALAVCAIGAKALGVDVEQWKPRPNLNRLMRKFHSREREWLETKPPEVREEAFYDLWVRKESYLKALGEGLRLPLSSFCAAAGEEERDTGMPDAVSAVQSAAGKTYFIRQYKLENQKYSLAVCSEEPDFAEMPLWLPLDGEF